MKQSFWRNKDSILPRRDTDMLSDTLVANVSTRAGVPMLQAITVAGVHENYHGQSTTTRWCILTALLPFKACPNCMKLLSSTSTQTGNYWDLLPKLLLVTQANLYFTVEQINEDNLGIIFELWVLIRIASPRRFLEWTPTTYVFMENHRK